MRWFVAYSDRKGGAKRDVTRQQTRIAVATAQLRHWRALREDGFLVMPGEAS